MQLTAKLLTLLPLQTGKGKNGDWKKQDFIVETGDTYPKKICVSVWGDKINPSVLVVGNELKIDFDVESREYNGRWYTDVKAWRIELASAGKINDTFEMKSPNSENIIQSQFVEEDDVLPF
jgi:hypothetical protein